MNSSDDVLSSLSSTEEGKETELSTQTLSGVLGMCGFTMRLLMENSFGDKAKHLRFALLVHANSELKEFLPGGNSLLKSDFRNLDVLATILENHAKTLRDQILKSGTNKHPAAME